MDTFHPVVVAAKATSSSRDVGSTMTALRRGLVLVPALMALVVVCLVAASSSPKATPRPSQLLGWGELSAQASVDDQDMMQALATLNKEPVTSLRSTLDDYLNKKPVVSLGSTLSGRPSITLGARSQRLMRSGGNTIDLAPKSENLAGMYTNHRGRFFEPAHSKTFSLIKLDNVDVTFLDKTNLKGYDAADMATLGEDVTTTASLWACVSYVLEGAH
jgi:hypothetical protein